MDLNYVDHIPGLVKVKRALLSVADKEGLEELVEGLVSINPEIVLMSTGGTAKTIEKVLSDMGEKASRASFVPVSEYTGQPEMQGGLVKTLDFKIYLGLLSEQQNPDHIKDLERNNASMIDLVVVNLYPFRETIAKADSTLENARSNIDIGGPCMLRAGCKNFHRVAVLCNPSDYHYFLDELRNNDGSTAAAQRFQLAKKGFKHTADYDTTIADYLNPLSGDELNKVYKFQ